MEIQNKHYVFIILILITLILEINCGKRSDGSDGSNNSKPKKPRDAKNLFSTKNIEIFSKMVVKLVMDLKSDLQNVSFAHEKCIKKLNGTSDNGSPIVILYADGSEDITLTSLLYEESAPWSACRRSCKTSRIRKCRVKNLCEVDVFVEEAYCFIPGSKCEKKVNQIFEDQTTGKPNTNKQDKHNKNEEDEEKEEKEEKEEEEEDKEIKFGMEEHNTNLFFDENHDYHYHNSDDDYNTNSKETEDDDLYLLGDAMLDLFGPVDMDTESYDDFHSENDVESENPEEVYEETSDGESNSPKADADDSITFTNDCGKSSIAAPHKMYRIIGGREVIKGSWPWQVAILSRFKDVFCGGTLIAPNWILTAAHCVRKTLYVRVAEHDISSPDGEIELKVVKSFKHPDFSLETIDNDIALLKIKENKLKGKSVALKSACLPTQMEKLPRKQSCVVLGWGKVKENNLFGSDILRYAKVPIVGQKTCERVYSSHGITRNMFCAGVLKGGLDTCEGDSGGPLLCQDDSLRWILQGVTSFGEGCGDKNRFGVYVKVANYVQWINKTIAQN